MSDLPDQIRALIAYRRASDEDEQVAILSEHRFRWDLLADYARGVETWKDIATQMGPQALRMNLNTLMRHGVLEDDRMIANIAERLGSEDDIRRSRQFPYQYLAASINADASLPLKIRHALGQAAEIACGNVPKLPGPIVIGVDVSGSMSCSITGWRGRGATSKVRCVDVAAMFAAAILRQNPESLVIPFDHQTYDLKARTSQPILRLAEQLARFGGGGTDCSLPLAHATNHFKDRAFAGAVMVSDCESWIGSGRYGSTGVMKEWNRFVKNQKKIQGKNASPKLICIDLQPYTTVQAPDRDDILNVGGFSDAVFKVVSSFLEDDVNRFVSEIESIEV